MVCASPSRWPSRASSESRKSGPPRRPSTITSPSIGAPHSRVTSSTPSRRLGRSRPIQPSVPGAASVARTTRAVGGDPRGPVDAEGDRQQVEHPVDRLGGLGGQLLDDLEVEEQVAAGGVPVDPQHLDAVEGVAGRDDGVGHRAGADLEEHVVDRAAVGALLDDLDGLDVAARPHRSRSRRDPAIRGRRAARRAAGTAWLEASGDVLRTCFPYRSVGRRRRSASGVLSRPARRTRRPLARWACRSIAARTAASGPTTRTWSLGPGDRGVEQLAGQQPRLLVGQQHGHHVGLAALALVDRHRVHGLDVAEPATGRSRAARRRRRRSRPGGRRRASPPRRRCRRCRCPARSRWR